MVSACPGSTAELSGDHTARVLRSCVAFRYDICLFSSLRCGGLFFLVEEYTGRSFGKRLLVSYLGLSDICCLQSRDIMAVLAGETKSNHTASPGFAFFLFSFFLVGRAPLEFMDACDQKTKTGFLI